MCQIEDYPSIAVVCYVRHKSGPPGSLREAIKHVAKCNVCQEAFAEEAKKRVATPVGRGWWTGDDPYLAKVFGTLK